MLLKSAGSQFSGFPGDRFTTLEETEDRILATRLTARWTYPDAIDDYLAIWEEVRSTLLESFATFDSASAQNQGYQMGRAAASHPEVGEIRLRLPNVHHLDVDLTPICDRRPRGFPTITATSPSPSRRETGGDGVEEPSLGGLAFGIAAGA